MRVGVLVSSGSEREALELAIPGVNYNRESLIGWFPPGLSKGFPMRCVPLCLLLLALSACSLFGPSGPHYVVFFQERSTQLDAPARSVITHAARRANADPAARVEVSGYTDSAGSPQADVLLSQERAQVVADALVASGVAANRLVRKGQGQTGRNPGVASRRVEINVGGL